ncbi:chemotaxis protein CheD [Azoarcus sp. L1K30]|uniref:chemotaxis protein CheD n=1 Tax=Azoarcus sp. L1K30 TaxID=2820277 RepID=UPI001B833CE6|nr:chemotaxis protein CheD [Azoarcus sp. L1K30]MBR0566956.1 chemotaxis protein CheD [Azoarcus sp. L1K30]
MSSWQTMSAQEIERLARNIAPGGWLVERERPLSTLLGSCVAVCLYDEAARIGGMNHFMLPTMRRNGAQMDVDNLLSGDYAMEVLLNALLAKGAARHRIKAKAFGAGTILTGAASLGIGIRNADFARKWLSTEGIPLVASDFLGPWSRKVLFVPEVGDAYCRRMPTSLATAQEIAREEAAYAESLQRRPPSSNVELF